MDRRSFLNRMGVVSGSACLIDNLRGVPAVPGRFKLGAISDGFSQDFEEALKVMQSYGLRWVEIRQVFGIYNTETTPAQVQRLKDLVNQYGFRVSVIDSALYKCTLPGTTPITKEKDTYPYEQQMDLLKRACDRAHALGAQKIRGFNFWRVAEPTRIADRIAEELGRAAEAAKRSGMLLVIENEESCNAATGRELAETLARVPASNLGANWDVGNGYMQGEVSYPDGYNALDKKRIWHMHLKGMTCKSGLNDCIETVAGEGQVDLVGQFKALLKNRYDGTMSVECESRTANLTHAESTKRSLEGVLRIITMATGENR